MKNPLNRVKVKTKLIVIYLLTIFVAMGILTGFYIASVSNDTKKLAHESMVRQMEICADSAAEIITGAFYVSADVGFNDEIHRYFAEAKQDDESYRNVIKNIRGIVAVYSRYIVDIFFYSDVKTYATLGTINYVENIENISEYEWGAQLLSSGKDIVVSHYPDSRNKTKLSLVRYCFSEEENLNCVLKVDINLPEIRNAFVKNKSKNYDSEISLMLNGETVLLSGSVNEKRNLIHDEVKIGSSAILSGLSVGVRAEEANVYRTANVRTLEAVSLFVAILALSVVAVLFALKSVTGKLNVLSEHMTKAANGSYDLIAGDFGKDEIGESIDSYNAMVSTINLLFKDVDSAKIREEQLHHTIITTRYKALKAQIDPHYFYNVLSSIQAQSLLKGETETAQIILALAKMFRSVVDWKDDLITIENELDNIERYMQIQKYRFQDKFKYEINCDDALTGLRIPKMTILTLVENACKHGIVDDGGDGVVRVNICEEGEKLRIAVYDNGKPLSEEDVKRIFDIMHTDENIEDSKGLNNIYDRLQMYYKSEMEINILPDEKEGNTFEIIIDKSAFTERTTTDENFIG